MHAALPAPSRVDYVVNVATEQDGRELVAAVRRAAAVHNATWETLVPDQFTINLLAEEAEEQAFVAMAREKARLRDHICEIYGISIRELSSLAQP